MISKEYVEYLGNNALLSHFKLKKIVLMRFDIKPSSSLKNEYNVSNAKST